MYTYNRYKLMFEDKNHKFNTDRFIRVKDISTSIQFDKYYISVNLQQQNPLKIQTFEQQMQPLSHRSIGSHHKQNTNYYNIIISPQSSYHLKAHATRFNTHRKCLTTQMDKDPCENQDGRLATHCIVDQDEQVLKYCEKCAIMLASRGFNIDKLAVIETRTMGKKVPKILLSSRKPKPRDYRAQRVNSLKQGICQGSEQLSRKYAQLQSQLIQSQQTYASLIGQVSEYFRQIEQVTEYQKYLSYNKILQERSKSQKDLRQFKGYTGKILEELQSMTSDLEQNGEMVRSVSNQQFDSIIGNYQSKVSHVYEILRVNPQIQVYQEVHIPDFPESLNKLADLVVLSHEQQFRISRVFGHSSSNNQKKLVISSEIGQPEQEDQFYNQENQPKFQQYHNSYQQISQHSFCDQKTRKHSLTIHKDFIDSKMKSHPKQIFLQNSFSLASSIVNNDTQSFQQCQSNVAFDGQQDKFADNNFLGNTYKSDHHHHHINQFDESLAHYLMNQSSQVIQQTINQFQNNQTMLLNQ